MRKFSIATIVFVTATSGWSIDRNNEATEAAVDPVKENAKASLPSLAPPPTIEDEWIRWLAGEWESSAESDNGPFRNWVRGRGRMKVELGLGGQFVMMSREGRVAEISEEYVRHLRETMHASAEDIENLRRLPFANLEIRTVDPKSGSIIGYLFDSWRCVAKGIGKREGNQETMHWEWSAAGQGTSVRVTEKLGDNRLIMTEKYPLPDGGIMEDRTVMTRKR